MGYKFRGGGWVGGKAAPYPFPVQSQSLNPFHSIPLLPPPLPAPPTAPASPVIFWRHSKQRFYRAHWWQALRIPWLCVFNQSGVSWRGFRGGGSWRGVFPFFFFQSRAKRPGESRGGAFLEVGWTQTRGCFLTACPCSIVPPILPPPLPNAKNHPGIISYMLARGFSHRAPPSSSSSFFPLPFPPPALPRRVNPSSAPAPPPSPTVQRGTQGTDLDIIGKKKREKELGGVCVLKKKARKKG